MARGSFLQPKSGEEDTKMMLHLGSPIGTFVADRCVLGPEYSIEKADLYRAYKEWCASTGREKSGRRLDLRP